TPGGAPLLAAARVKQPRIAQPPWGRFATCLLKRQVANLPHGASTRVGHRLMSTTPNDANNQPKKPTPPQKPVPPVAKGVTPPPRPVKPGPPPPPGKPAAPRPPQAGADKPAAAKPPAGKPPADKPSAEKPAPKPKEKKEPAPAPKRVSKGGAARGGGRRFGQVLVDLGFADEEQLWEVLEEAKSTGQFIGQVAVARGLINEDQ